MNDELILLELRPLSIKSSDGRRFFRPVSAIFGRADLPRDVDGYWFDDTRRGARWMPCGGWEAQEKDTVVWHAPGTPPVAGVGLERLIDDLPPGWGLRDVVAHMANSTETSGTLWCAVCDAEPDARLLGPARYPIEDVCPHIEAARCPTCRGLRWEGLDECECEGETDQL